MTKTTDTDKTTAQLQAELDELLVWFESDKIDIDEAVIKYEQGLELIAQIEKRLKSAENTVKKLSQRFDVSAEISEVM